MIAASASGRHRSSGSPRRGKGGSWFGSRLAGIFARQTMQVLSIPSVPPQRSTGHTARVVPTARPSQGRCCAVGFAGSSRNSMGTSKTSATSIRPSRARAAGSRDRPRVTRIPVTVRTGTLPEHLTRVRPRRSPRRPPAARFRAFLSRSRTAARKNELSGVVVDVRGTAREQDRRPWFTLDHRHRTAGGPDFRSLLPKGPSPQSTVLEVAGSANRESASRVLHAEDGEFI